MDASGTTAAAILPEVVLLDIGLPAVDGYEVARHLRTMPALRDALLIAMTGYSSPEDLDILPDFLRQRP